MKKFSNLMNANTGKNETGKDTIDLSKVIIPAPFFRKDGSLWMSINKNENQICRHFPYLIKKYENNEDENVFFELMWIDESGKEKKQLVSASVLAQSNDLKNLSKKGFGVNDNNCKSLIKFFNDYLGQNQLEPEKLVSRLGHTESGFIHPLIDAGVKVLPNSEGEKQLLQAFQAKGSTESWKKEILNRMKKYPKALFYILTAFAAPLLRDLRVDSFIVEVAGHTSQGKTTLLRTAVTVWGMEDLMGEWNTTGVKVEQSSAFLNSFPLFLDDTKKVNSNTSLQEIIYQFSGGRSKGRGGLKSIQTEKTWRTIMLSTGEDSITEYAEAAGAAARVLSIVDQPFGQLTLEAREDIKHLYEAMRSNYGIVGKEFIEKWTQMNPETKEERIEQFQELRDHYIQESGENEVLARLASYYAVIDYTARILNELLDFEIDSALVKKMFIKAGKENKAIDKPKQRLEEMFAVLDTERLSICTKSNNLESRQVKAYLKEGTLYLAPAYCKRFLKEEEKSIRTEWQKRGYTITQKEGKDYKTININGKTYKGIEVNNDLVNEAGFDYSSQ